MSSLFVTMLSTHVILGVVGLIASYAVLLGLLKKGASGRAPLVSGVIATVSYLLSWFSGGYYYVLYYGSAVKPVIKEGTYPWAHLVFMEWKEHAFLVLPVTALTLTVGIWLWRNTGQNETLRNPLVYVAAIVVILATLITLSGVIISGAAR